MWLDDKYISLVSPKLVKFKKKSSSLYNFRCPYCGDSKTNLGKTRGYLYEVDDGFNFKCHNCDVSKPFQYFLKDQDYTLFTKYKFEKFGNTVKDKFSFTTEKIIIENKSHIKNYAIHVPLLSNKHESKTYLRTRHIPEELFDRFYYTEDLNNLKPLFPKYAQTVYNPEEPRLILPCYNQNNKLIGVITRALYPSSLRYINMKVEWWDTLVYGLERVNFSKHIYITEGPIDSLFLPNAVAFGSMESYYILSVCDKEKTTIVLDNTPRNKDLLRHIKTFLNSGWAITIWPENIKEKDINDMIKEGDYSKEDILEIINANTYRGLTGLLKLSEWSKIS